MLLVNIGISPIQPIFAFAIILVFSAGATLFYYHRILTFYGSLSTGFLGIYLSIILGYEWILPVLYFFTTSVILTRINASKKSGVGFNSTRNMWQVLANIFPAIVVSILFFVFNNYIFYYLFIALVAAVTADTWASELGPVFNKRCFSLSGFKIMNAGTTGGISLGGSLAALSGSFSVTAFSLLLIHHSFNAKHALIISLSGFLASFVDSLLGAFWEPRIATYKYFTNDRMSKFEKISPNDVINFVGSGSSVLFYLLFTLLF